MEGSVSEQGDLASCLSSHLLEEVGDSSDSSAADVEDYRLRVKRIVDELYSRMTKPEALHYLLRSCVEKYGRPDIKPSDSIRPENFLFENQLLPSDNVMLLLPGKMVRAHFPSVGNSRDYLVCLTFTDAQNKQWCTEIMPDQMGSDFDTYVVVSGWESFAKEYNLQYKDVVKFYKPDQALEWGDGQFLVDFERRRNPATTTTRKRRRGDESCCGS